MKRIVVATDLSARSDRALERAVRLASDHESELTVVHVVDEGLPVSLADMQEQAAKRAIQDQVDALTTGARPQISIAVVFGKVNTSILAMLEKLEADLLVLGMHREDSFKDMFRGTTVERIIRTVNVPVLLAKDRPKSSYRRVMVGVDFSVYSRRAVECAIKFVPGGEYVLVHAYNVPFKGFIYGEGARGEISKQHQTQFTQMIDGEMATFLSGLGEVPITLEHVMEEGTVREVIHRQLGRLKPDLLVIGTHGRTGVAHAFLGSVAEDLLRDPPCDVLAVKAW